MEYRHEIPKELTSGSKEDRLRKLRELKEREAWEQLDRQNRKVAKLL